MIPLKSKEDLEIMRQAGSILSRVMRKVQAQVKAGITTQELNRLTEEYIAQEENVFAAFKGYNGYPASICTSVNEEIVHGLPGERKLCEGDIIGLDLGINYQGFFSDIAVTLPIGKIDSGSSRLIEVAKKALSEGIRRASPGRRVSDISYAIQNYVESNKFSVVRQFVGHGIGKKLHEEPEIPNFGRAGEGAVLKEGMVLAIEPMVNMGSWESEIKDNGWTAITKDKSYSAHFEHTVAITQNGPEILTN